MLFSSCKHSEIEESKKKRKKKKKQKQKQKKKSTDTALLHDQKWASSSRSCNTSTRSLKTASDETITRAASYSSYSSVNSAAAINITTTCSSPSSLSSLGGSFRGVHLRKLSGCYDQCHAVVGPLSWVSRDPSLRATLTPCPHCGDIFMKPENLETHQALRHAVSELGPEDTSRSIVEIIFHSNWLKKHVQPPVCRIDKVLKIHNTSKTTAKFEDYRETIKTKANKLPKMYPRCIADGNELLRFHCTTFACSLGLDRSAGLCLNPKCNLCIIIRDGFAPDSLGRITTTASSGRADEMVRKMSSESERRAMMVCRVIAGRVKKSCEYDCQEDCDSVVSSRVGAYSNLDELLVFNPSAILPCFVVIYSGY